MKKIVVGVVLAVLLTVGLAQHSASAAALPEVKVFGVITQDGNPVAGIKVMVECWETGFVERPITDANGVYRVVTSEHQCPLGTTLKVRSNTNFNARVGFKFGTVSPVNELNIELIDTHGVPEYGWLGGFLAAGTGIGAIAYTRRRYAHKLVS